MLLQIALHSTFSNPFSKSKRAEDLKMSVLILLGDGILDFSIEIVSLSSIQLEKSDPERALLYDIAIRM